VSTLGRLSKLPLPLLPSSTSAACDVSSGARSEAMALSTKAQGARARTHTGDRGTGTPPLFAAAGRPERQSTENGRDLRGAHHGREKSPSEKNAPKRLTMMMYTRRPPPSSRAHGHSLAEAVGSVVSVSVSVCWRPCLLCVRPTGYKAVTCDNCRRRRR
jgi:cytolysin (calcineurin-like family phosphatase)